MADPSTPAPIEALPSRDVPALVEALRIRALALTDAEWERTATRNMMNEAAEQLESQQVEIQALREEIAQLKDWRDYATIALQRPGGTHFADVPQHIRDLVSAFQTARVERDEALVQVEFWKGSHDPILKPYRDEICAAESALAASRQRETQLRAGIEAVLKKMRQYSVDVWTSKLEAALAAVDRPAPPEEPTT